MMMSLTRQVLLKSCFASVRLAIRSFAGSANKKKNKVNYKRLRKLNIKHRHQLILRFCDERFKRVIEDPRRKTTTWYPIERLIYHNQFRGWAKLRTILGAFIGSKDRYLLKKGKDRALFCINLEHPRYVAQRERAIQENPSLSSSESERFRLRNEKQSKEIDFHKDRKPPLFPGRPENDVFK